MSSVLGFFHGKLIFILHKSVNSIMSLTSCIDKNAVDPGKARQTQLANVAHLSFSMR